ncbi:VOC family protein [Actinomadura chibensis]|uniref:VOC family protein n=1 Tax=Actinomadura chibensis TaxID=392828 RepID=A0A5D0NVH3_9ACTN|nr:VOC family protein [Actinomadura chibensis]TYB48188.1 VOC family protein [Actinomadura chibensis]
MTGPEFDHLMIAVADLDAAAERYRGLGFEVRPGGRHRALGTENAIIPFRAGRYIELIGMRDADAARRRLNEGDRFAALVDAHDELPMIFVLRAGDLADVRARLASAGIATGGPDLLARDEPSGRTVSCSILQPGAGPWRRGFPSFIDWGDSAHPAAVPGVHPNGATDLTGLDVLVPEVEPHVRHYRALGFGSDADGAVDLDGFDLRFCRPSPDAADALAAHGAGVTAVRLAGDGTLAVGPADDRPFSLSVDRTAR